jgi:hypothetical protein
MVAVHTYNFKQSECNKKKTKTKKTHSHARTHERTLKIKFKLPHIYKLTSAIEIEKYAKD